MRAPGRSMREMLCALWQSSQTGRCSPSLGLTGGVDALGERLLDAEMTLAAGIREIRPVDRRARVVGRQLAMRRVAVHAGRRDDEPGFGEALAVDRVGVAADDVGRRAVNADCRLRPDAMAASAERRHVARERRRERLVLRLGGVRRVAVEADRSVWILLRRQRSVNAGVVLLDLLRVTDTAIDLLGDRLARPVMRRRNLVVALRASGLGVRRGGVGDRIGVERDLLAVALHRQIGLAVAGQAILVRHAGAVEDPPHFVGLVAVDADRDLVRCALPQVTFDHLAVHDFDLPVALGAGLDDVAHVDRRLRDRCAAGCCGRNGRRCRPR